jgi:D-alanyl-lipoteichoic acid acyltransferase DltB (MBOAT superfamily)
LESSLLQYLVDALVYQPNEPMLFNSGHFLLWFFVFLGIYSIIYKKVVARLIFVISFSLFFYYKASEWYVLVLISTITLDFFLGYVIYKLKNNRWRTFTLICSISINLGLLAYFKYTGFLFDVASDVLNLFTGKSIEKPIRFIDIYLPIGISFYTFQSLSYIIDIYRKKLTPPKSFLDYLFYMTFFPHLVAGPIVRAKDFLPQVRESIIISNLRFREAWYLIAKGLIKKVIFADFLSRYVDLVFAIGAEYKGFDNLMGMYAYAMQIYCDFSGYTDMAIGIGLLMGYRLGINFKEPYKATSITDFWRRWHISLSNWLRDYLYISLGGNRKGKTRQYLNLMITMLLGGLWHGASWQFVVWGGVHGLALALHKLVENRFGGLKTTRLSVFFNQLITFHLVAILWVFFRAQSFDDAFGLLQGISEFQSWAYIEVFIAKRWDFMLILSIAYVLIWLPTRVKSLAMYAYFKSPLLLKAAFLFAIVVLMLQLKEAGVQPFIYFQF